MKVFLPIVLGTCWLSHCLSSYAAGRQLTGQHAPATTPALSPAEAQKKFTVPAGFEVRLFASEPDVINPVAMTWDDRGRLWIVELYEYPLGAPAGTKPRDRVLILEDTDGDGRADKRTIFADGLNLATGILLGNGGVYIGQAPHLLFLEDTDGDDHADKRTVLMTGFGLEDRHELLNGFTWGPDGWLYMTHGVFTRSLVKDPQNPNAPEVLMTAAVARFHPRTKKFEIFAEGTSNPWGVDFDAAGNAFVSACVIDHLFHMAPGGIYVRQAGSPPNPYAYELIPSIVDHKHFRAAYAGIQVYQGNQYPDEYRGTILMGNIHDSAVHQDKLTPSGSSFKASFIQDFVRANDGWFRPVSSQIGPDGALWIMDWYDKYPCYQNANADPEGVDRERGRIWRVVYTGGKANAAVPSRPPGLNLGKASSEELVRTLAHPNVWHRRMAQRLLSERRDASTKAALAEMAARGATLEAKLAALWTLHGSGLLEESVLETASGDTQAPVRAWAARLTGERGEVSELAARRLLELARDQENSVRLAVAVALRQFVSGSLTIDTPVRAELEGTDVGPVLARLIQQPNTGNDPLLSFMIWMVAEPGIGRDPGTALSWLASRGQRYLPLSATLTRKAMRRICDSQRAEHLEKAVTFLEELTSESEELAIAALTGLIEGQQGKAFAPSKVPTALLARLSKSTNKEIVSRSQQLGTLWGDAAALLASLKVAEDRSAPADQRLQAIQAVRQQKSEAARATLVRVLAEKDADKIVQAALRALSEIGGDTVAHDILGKWSSFTPATRRAAAEALASRANWARILIAGIEKKTVEPSEIPLTVVRSLTESKDDYARNRAIKAIGKVRAADADKSKLIAAKRRIVLEGPIDLEAGREVARKTCFVCHKLHGEGADVGPDLTGVGRSTLDALLANVIDPNQIVGKGYENVEIETRDGRTVAGRVVEDTETHVKLLAAGPKEDVVNKNDIKQQRISELSVMPEGLEQMPDADFRNLIWYILNPPQDKRPMTPQLRKELVGEDKPSASNFAPQDAESIALWNPEWRVDSPQADGHTRKFPEFASKSNVLMTHPFDRETGASIERRLRIPAGRKTELLGSVAAEPQGNWELRVLVNGMLIHKMLVNREGEIWKEIRLDLTRFAGEEIRLRLENCAGGSAAEHGFWTTLAIRSSEVRTAVNP